MIKPYLNYSIHIKNLLSYRNLLKKNPKKTHQFKLSMIQTQHKLTQANEKQVQLKLLRALKILKQVTKIDFRRCEISSHDFWKATLLSAFKRISHIKTLCIFGPKRDFEVNYFKHFAKLKNLIEKVEGYGLSLDYPGLRPTKKSLGAAHNYLASLKYCPKIRLFDFANFSENYLFPKTRIGSNRYFRSLDSLVIRDDGCSGNCFEFLIESWKNLKSCSLQFSNLEHWDSLPHVMDVFSKLAHLQEIQLRWIKDLMFDFVKAFRKITKKGMLKKVSLEFLSSKISLENVLKVLKPCKLTHFAFGAHSKGGLVKPITQFLQDMSHLETLELHIINSNLFSKHDNFIEMCRHINKLQVLWDLTLHFQTSAEVSKSTPKILNFIPSLSDTFTKPIKIKTFHIECNQLDSSKALESLVPLLQNSAAFLTHLKIDFGTLTCTKKTYRAILKLLQNLSKIQVLEIPCIGVSDPTSQFLSEISEALSRSKYLRVLEIGQIKGTVALSAFYKTIEFIVSKRGLRKFCCSLAHDFLKSSTKNEKTQDLNLRRILEKNPYLETVTSTGKLSEFNFELQKWTED